MSKREDSPQFMQGRGDRFAVNEHDSRRFTSTLKRLLVSNLRDQCDIDLFPK
jgi:hypothetical protein